MVMKVLRQNRWVAHRSALCEFVSYKFTWNADKGGRGRTAAGYAEIRYGAPALVNDPDLLVKDASTRQDREPVNILSSIVFQEWNKPGSKSHAFQIQKA